MSIRDINVELIAAIAEPLGGVRSLLKKQSTIKSVNVKFLLHSFGHSRCLFEVIFSLQLPRFNLKFLLMRGILVQDFEFLSLFFYNIMFSLHPRDCNVLAH